MSFAERIRLAYLDAAEFIERRMLQYRRVDQKAMRDELVDEWHRLLMIAQRLERL